ncbi:MAG: AsmA family protein [Rhodocyclaceae bacterium]|nr:AsmA family protein [Rhodocyclaceae bacterium]
MKSALRFVVGLAVLVALVMAALAAYLAFLFDPNDYRDRLTELVKTHTGRTLAIQGDIGLSFFPWLGFRLGAVELGNAPGFSERPFAALASAEARIKILPLLGGAIAIDTVSVQGLQLNLERRKDGVTNWDDLAGGKKDATASGDEGKRAGGGAASLAVGGIDIREGAIRWDDAQAGRSDALSGVALRTGEISPGQPFDFEAGASFALADPAVNGRVTLAGRAALDLAAQQYRVDDLKIALKADGAGLPGGALDAQLAATLRADLAAGTASLGALTLTAKPLQLTGSLDATALNSAPAFSGRIEVAGFNPRDWMQSAGIAAPVTANPARLTRAALKASISGTTTRVALSEVVATLDDSTLTGQIDVADLGRKALRFEVAIDALDVDSYLPPPTKAGSGAAPAAKGAASPALDLRGHDVAGRARVGKLTVSGLALSEVDARVSLSGGRLEVASKAGLYSGRLDGTASVVARGAPAQIGFVGGVADVQLAPLLRDLTGQPEKLTGRARVDANVNGVGLDPDALKRSLAGTVKLKVADGAVKGVNVARFFREAEARLTGQSLPADAGAEQTDFSDLSASLNIADGVVRNNDLSLRSPLLRVGGEGSANLVSEGIDYLVKASLVGTLTGQGGKSLDQVRELTIPVRVSGTFGAPRYALDTEALLAGSVKQRLEAEKAAIKEKVDAARDKARDSLKDELKKGLGGLFR